MPTGNEGETRVRSTMIFKHSIGLVCACASRGTRRFSTRATVPVTPTRSSAAWCGCANTRRTAVVRSPIFFLQESFSAEAVTDIVLIAYPRTQIDRLSATKPGVVNRIFAVLTDQFLSMQGHLVVLGCRNAKERLASFLLHLADRSSTVPGERLELPMGRQDIASHLGLTIETVSRALGEL